MTWSQTEYHQKVERVRELLRTQQAEAILLEQAANFAWLTGGRGFVAMGAELSRAAILITLDQVWVITNNIEAARLAEEEFKGLALEVVSYPWYDAKSMQAVVQQLSGGLVTIANDRELGLTFNRLRWSLLPGEIEVYRKVSKLAAEAITEVCWQFQRGDTEMEIAGLLSKAAFNRGLTPAVILVGADDRAYTRRHPMPTGKSVKDYALLVLSAQQNGLYTSSSRLVHFGAVSDELKRRHEAVCRIDVTYMEKTIPGMTLGDIFQAGVEAYAAEGFDGEWRNHHQGGSSGYLGREVLASPGNSEIVQLNQAFGWNPTISGVKSEDTVLVTSEGVEILTVCDGFPLKQVTVDGVSYLRPDILVRK